jgi:hypothetical protein
VLETGNPLTIVDKEAVQVVAVRTLHWAEYRREGRWELSPEQRLWRVGQMSKTVNDHVLTGAFWFHSQNCHRIFA